MEFQQRAAPSTGRPRRRLQQQAASLAIQDTRPDVVILLDLDPETGLTRNKTADTAAATKDGFEKETLEFHRRLRYGFLKIAEDLEEPFVIIDADRSTDEVWDDIQSVLEQVIR